MAVYDINGNIISQISNEPKLYKMLAYNVGNFADGSHDRYQGNDLEGWITKWIQFFGKNSADLCLFTESSGYIDNSNTAQSNKRIYSKLYKYVSEYAPNNSFGAVVSSNNEQQNVVSGMFTNRISSEAKYIHTVITLNNVDLFIAVAHCNHTVIGQEEDSFAIRAAEMSELITMASSYSNVIIGGDFNARSVSEFAPFVDAGYTLANGGIFGLFDTWPANDPIYPCDNIAFKGDKILLKDFETIDGVTENDHLATVAKFLIG